MTGDRSASRPSFSPGDFMPGGGQSWIVRARLVGNRSKCHCCIDI